MKVFCPHCSIAYNLKRASVGQKFYCTSCSQYFFASEKDIRSEEPLPQAPEPTIPILEDHELPACDLFDKDMMDSDKGPDLIPVDEELQAEAARSRRQARRKETKEGKEIDQESSDESKSYPVSDKNFGGIFLILLGMVALIASFYFIKDSEGLCIGFFLSGGLFLFLGFFLKILLRFVIAFENQISSSKSDQES